MSAESLDVDNQKISLYFEAMCAWIKNNVCPRYRDCGECRKDHRGKCLIWLCQDAQRKFDEFMGELIKEFERYGDKARFAVQI